MMNFTKIKKKAVIVGALVVALSAVGITYALLSSSSQQNVNKFEGAAAKVNIAVIENDNEGKYIEDEPNNKNSFSYEIDKKVDKKVKIKNVYDPSYPTTDCYIRVKFVPMLEDKQGNVIGKKLNIEYNLNENSSNWVYDANSDTYYYTQPVAPNDYTEQLLDSVVIKANDEAEKSLLMHSEVKIEVMADAISAYPDTNLKDAWGLKNQNGNYFSSFTPISSK